MHGWQEPHFTDVVWKSFLLPILGSLNLKQVYVCIWKNLFQMPEDSVLVKDVKENYENKCPIHMLGK